MWWEVLVDAAQTSNEIVLEDVYCCLFGGVAAMETRRDELVVNLSIT